MKTLLELCLVVGVALGLAVEGKVRQYQPLKALHPSNANFREASGQVLFSPGGKLYAAYRALGKGGTSSTLRVVLFDPVTGQQSNVRDYPVPSAHLPRVATAFVLSPDGSTLAYAELHAPQVILTIQAAALNPMSISDVSIFGDEDSGPRISAVDSHSLLLSSDKLGKNGRVTITQAVRKLSLSVGNLRQIISDQTIQPDADPEGPQYWHKRLNSPLDIISVMPVQYGVLGMMSDGSMQLFDETGKEVAALHNPSCGFVRASLSLDQQVGAAVCEKTGLDEAHFGETLSRDAIVFEVKTLKVLATIPMSRLSLKEDGPRRDDFWVATPSPAVWYGNDRVLVAIPDFPDSINLYSISKPTPTTR